MMPLVMARCYQPFPQLGMNKSAREHFPPHMIGDAHNGHDCQHQPEHRHMDGYHKQQQRDNHRARNSLKRMEAHCGPRRGRAAGMMDCVRDLEQTRLMHPAMSPVKPRIVEQEIEQQR